jgi:hypothetical protein
MVTSVPKNSSGHYPIARYVMSNIIPYFLITFSPFQNDETVAIVTAYLRMIDVEVMFEELLRRPQDLELRGELVSQVVGISFYIYI